MRNRVDHAVALEVASHEAIIRRAYKDSVGVWTWSVGLTSATGHNVERYIDAPASLQKCLDIYVWALRRYAKQVDEAFAGVNLTKTQYAAAVSFHWNTGGIKKAAWVRHFKAGNIDKARTAFMSWRKPASIIGRREAERDLFFDGVWSNRGTMTEFTRLTKKHTPVWASGRTIDVSEELRPAFGAVEDQAPIDLKPKPNAKVTQPTLSPPKPKPVIRRQAPVERKPGWFGNLFSRWRRK